jgi:hypothetical protein
VEGGWLLTLILFARAHPHAHTHMQTHRQTHIHTYPDTRIHTRTLAPQEDAVGLVEVRDGLGHVGKHVPDFGHGRLLECVVSVSLFVSWYVVFSFVYLLCVLCCIFVCLFVVCCVVLCFVGSWGDLCVCLVAGLIRKSMIVDEYWVGHT